MYMLQRNGNGGLFHVMCSDVLFGVGMEFMLRLLLVIIKKKGTINQMLCLMHKKGKSLPVQ